MTGLGATAGVADSLRLNDQGEVVIYIQHESLGAEHESNWLPAPAEPFNTVMRVYLPRPEALDGSWAPPTVEKA